MERLDDAEDKRLMAALSAGRDHALDRIVHRWQRPLRAFILRSTGDEEDADDLLQETFVRVYKHRGRYQPTHRFSTWIYTIALNLCRNHAEKRDRRPQVSLDAPIAGSDSETSGGQGLLALHASEAPSPAAAALDEERAEAVREAVQTLPDEMREAVLLFEFQELSYAEIAEIVGSTPKAVESRLYRARAHLRQILSRWLAD
jgi:RNA polymerase sigma-70 factor (ECF subfamily)